jgi:hypothetical protein
MWLLNNQTNGWRNRPVGGVGKKSQFKKSVVVFLLDLGHDIN